MIIYWDSIRGKFSFGLGFRLGIKAFPAAGASADYLSLIDADLQLDILLLSQILLLIQTEKVTRSKLSRSSGNWVSIAKTIRRYIQFNNR